ncbi:MAG: serine hydrolase [Crocinitomicaceae bacterium]|nr:serine hydrolase [Crocinitomicaceae bacterium]|tara:strand:- start:3851 stop:5011 length:1161 start_codon:yes stop_codon:yes gene_type:complete
MNYLKGLLGLFFILCCWSCDLGKGSNSSGDPIPETIYVIPPELEPKVEKIKKLVDQQSRKGLFNGVVLVADYGNVIYVNSNGYANYKRKEKLNDYSVFQLASVSKMFTATAIMLLKQSGQLSFDDTVTNYLPLFPYKDVTIRNLLNHRSGIPRYMVVSDEFWPRDTMMTNEEMHDLMVAHCPEPYYPSNYKFNYQNSNYAYLALIVEKVSNSTFQTFCRDSIFEPLEMYDTRVFNGKDSADIPCSVTGHIYRRPRSVNAYNNYINGVVGDKGVYSSVYDLLKFDQALYDKSFIADSILEEAFAPGSPEKKSNRVNYGFGWRISPFEKDRLVFHYGWWNGFKTCFMRYLNSRRTIIVLTNRDRSLTLPKKIQEILFEEEVNDSKPKP